MKTRNVPEIPNKQIIRFSIQLRNEEEKELIHKFRLKCMKARTTMRDTLMAIIRKLVG